MKSIYFAFALLLFTICNAQIVNIPEANFKYALVNENAANFDGSFNYDSNVDTNNDR